MWSNVKLEQLVAISRKKGISIRGEDWNKVREEG
jgi:hypothetical protein